MLALYLRLLITLGFNTILVSGAYLPVVLRRKIQIVQKPKIIPFLPGKVLDLIHRHVCGKIETIEVLLYLSCQARGLSFHIATPLDASILLSIMFAITPSIVLTLTMPSSHNHRVKYPLSFAKLLLVLQMMVIMEKKFLPAVLVININKMLPRYTEILVQYISGRHIA